MEIRSKRRHKERRLDYRHKEEMKHLERVPSACVDREQEEKKSASRACKDGAVGAPQSGGS